MSLKGRNQLHRLVQVFIGIGLISLFTGCQPACRKMDPIIVHTPQSCEINLLPSAFPPLSLEERQQEWAKELIIGDVFARDLDLYRAITSYKRALILLPSDRLDRKIQIDYNLILAYYLGQKYQESVNIFEASELAVANPLFPAFNNLLLILYDCYLQLGQEDKTERIFELIEKFSPETAQDLAIYTALKTGNTACIQEAIQGHRNQAQVEESLALYDTLAKSPKKARTLNAILPGAGYYYIGQRKSAWTSFVINTLFTAAAYQFFHRGYWAAGLITTSLEFGWYMGGINGAGLEAEEFNTHLYEGIGKKVLEENSLFPCLMFETTF